MTHSDFVLLSYLCAGIAVMVIAWQTYSLWKKYYHIKQQKGDE